MKKPTAIGCYIFAGGFTLGVRRHFDVLAHFEQGNYGTATAALNIPELRGNIFTDPDSWPAADYAGRTDFVYANPPCAPWSVAAAGRRVPWRLDPRVGCVRKAYALLESVGPEVWAFESVRPTFTRGRELIDQLVWGARDLGYRATALLVEGSRHGVPQTRPRFFLVLSRHAIEWRPTGLRKVRTAGEALSVRFPSETFTGQEQRFNRTLAAVAKPGQKLREVFEELHPDRVEAARLAGTNCAGRPPYLATVLDASRPAGTLTGGAKYWHPDRTRMLSVEECAALCGYPRGFRFLGSANDRYKQVAQAVMPPVGEYLARAVAESLASRKRRAQEAPFEQVEVFQDRVERCPLEAQGQLPFDPDPPTKTVSLPPEEKDMASAKNGKTTVAAPAEALLTRTLLVDHPGGQLAVTVTVAVQKARVAEHSAAATGMRAKLDGAAPKKPVAAAAAPAAKQKGKPIAERAAPAAPAEPAKRGSGARIRELLGKGKGVEEILETIHREFPGSKAKASDVYWNRRKLQQAAA